MKYPYWTNIWLYIPLQTGFDNLRNTFNGFDELFARRDVCEVMINYYSRTDIQGVNSLTDSVEIGRYMSKILYWEITLAQYEYINSLTAVETRSVLALVLSKYFEKANIESYGLIGKGSTLSIAARILFKQGYIPFIEKISLNPGITQFLNDADFSNTPDADSIIQIVVNDSQDYLESLNYNYIKMMN